MLLIDKYQLLHKFAGEINLIVADIEFIFNEMLCDYFFGSHKKREAFAFYILMENKLSFFNKVECLKSICWEIDNDMKGEVFEQAINFACRFKILQDKFHYSIKCLDDNSRKLEIKTIHGIDRYEYTEITNEYINDFISKGIKAKHKLMNAREILNETVSHTRQKSD
jgi:hypothetical protein